MTPDYQRYHAAAARMDSLIDMTPSPTDVSRPAMNDRALIRMARMEEFLARLGNPHRNRPAVHVAGTSGKGSTSTAIASILTAAGYRTGLHMSPYLQTQTEKLQVNGRLVSPDDFADLVDEFFEAHDIWLADGHAPLSYYEASTVLMWLFFRAQDVEICVVEVGVGGRFDLTNILEPVICVITSVGIDHTQLLGDTIEEIAWNKAGIIKQGIPVVSGVRDPAAQEVIGREADLCGSPLLQLDIDSEIDHIVTHPDGTSWSEVDGQHEHHTGQAGSFQARNGHLATQAMRVLRGRGYTISEEAIDSGLRAARIPGRAEIINDIVPIVLDGAHNPEKVAAFAVDIPALTPVPNGKRIIVAGLLESKQGDAMLKSLVPHTDVLIATSPRVLAKTSLSVDGVERYARAAGYLGEVFMEPDPLVAIDHALSLAVPGEDAIVVTGSLYLVGNIRERWYPSELILETCSSWGESE